jgi:hypothetical protein
MSIKSRIDKLDTEKYTIDQAIQMAYGGHREDFQNGRNAMIAGRLVNGKSRKRKKNMSTVSKQARRKHRRARS